MPGQYVGIEDDDNHRLGVSPSGSLAVYSVSDPNATGAFLYTLTDAPGVVGANNFLSLFNPVGSGVVASLRQVGISSYSINAASARISMTMRRTTAASGGTLLVAPKMDSELNDSALELRSGNPTVTAVGESYVAVAPVVSTGSGNTGLNQITAPSGADPVLRPGEGTVLATSAGDVDQTWNITIAWLEYPEATF